jgi:hypothetical protein
MSKDPWSGNFVNPQSINGWSYVENNPANLADPSGMIPFPEDCRKAPSYPSYGDCVREAYGVYYEHSVPVSDYQAFVDEYLGGESAVPGPDESGCYEGPVPYRASGYTEGFSGSFSILFWLGAISGKEVVYDFATMERMRFRFTKNLEHNRGVITKGKSFDFPFSSSLIAGTATWYYGQVNGFRSWGGVDDGNKHTRLYDDYKGEFETSNIGHSLLVWAKGTSFFRATEDATIFGAAYYSSLGLDLGFPIDLGRGFTSYDKAEPDYYEPYFDGPDERGRKSVDPAIVYADLKTGLPGWDAGDFNISGHLIRRNLGQHLVFKYAEIYNGIHYDSYR